MEIKRAGDVMIPLEVYPHIPYWFTLRQTVAELESAQIEMYGRKSLPRWVLVFDEKYQLMGTVRRRDILRGLEAEFLSREAPAAEHNPFHVKVDPGLSELSYDKLLERMRKQAERPVSDVMQPIITTVEYEDNLIKVIFEMVDHNVSMIPVLKENKVAGVIRSTDVLHEVDKLVL
uniref:CBS-domain-containing protein n=1 Tax=uncultured sulfate-reducing bacterium TaxID=153939 RepID=Q3IBN5_9BACT|nr:CBS-domain-containing protein [uncultured sulfate-reducing bacterium]